MSACGLQRHPHMKKEGIPRQSSMGTCTEEARARVSKPGGKEMLRAETNHREQHSKITSQICKHFA